MKTTKNLGLKQPDPEDFYNIQDHNDNMETLDQDQARQDEAISQAQQQLDAARQALAQAAQRLATAEQAIAGHTAALPGHAGNATIHVTQAEKDGWNGKVPSTRKVNDKALSGDISLTAADVGALGSGSTAEAAKKLLTPRSIRANLASSAAANFDGTANITPGVTGVLPVANGGTGSSVEKYLPLAGGTIAGNLTLKNSTAFGCKLNFGDGDYVHISEPTDDNMEIKAKNVTFSTTNPIHGVPTPSAGTDAANKDYVDNKNAKAGSFYLSTLEISLVESLVEAGKIFKLKRKPVISSGLKDGTYQITSLYYSEGDEPLIVYAWPMRFSISGGDTTTELSVYIYNPSSSNIRMSRMSAAIKGCIVAYEGW